MRKTELEGDGDERAAYDEYEFVSLPHAASLLNVSPEFVLSLEKIGRLSRPKWVEAFNGREVRYYRRSELEPLRELRRIGTD